MATLDDKGRAVREALHAGLEHILDAAQAHSALVLWDREYAATRPNALIEYVNDVAAALALPTRQRHEVRMALYRALLARGIDPTQSRSGAPTPPAPRAPVEGTAAFRIFRSVALGVFDGVRRPGASASGAFIAALTRRTPGGGLTDTAQRALETWALQHDDDGYFRRLSPAEYAPLTHLIYVAACEALGPVGADRLFAQAIARAEALPEAAEFPPRRLL